MYYYLNEEFREFFIQDSYEYIRIKKTVATLHK